MSQSCSSTFYGDLCFLASLFLSGRSLSQLELPSMSSHSCVLSLERSGMLRKFGILLRTWLFRSTVLTAGPYHQWTSYTTTKTCELSGSLNVVRRFVCFDSVSSGLFRICLFRTRLNHNSFANPCLLEPLTSRKTSQGPCFQASTLFGVQCASWKAL